MRTRRWVLRKLDRLPEYPFILHPDRAKRARDMDQLVLLVDAAEQDLFAEADSNFILRSRDGE